MADNYLKLYQDLVKLVINISKYTYITFKLDIEEMIAHITQSFDLVGIGIHDIQSLAVRISNHKTHYSYRKIT